MSFPAAGTFGIVVTPTITVSASSAYQSGDNVGGKITLTNAARVSGGLSKLVSLNITDNANQKAACTLLIFNANPAAATLTDNSALALSTDGPKVIASVAIASASFVTIDSKGFFTLNNIGYLLQPASGTTLYAALVTTGTPTYAATTDLKIDFGIEYIN